MEPASVHPIVWFLDSDPCADLACGRRVPRGDGLCLHHEVDAQVAGRRFADDVETWLGLVTEGLPDAG